MRAYDRTQPLVMLHIPKTGGTSVQRIFRSWFGDGLVEHYFDESRNAMPTRHDLAMVHFPERPVVVYGHFNRLRGFGVDDYYPQVTQFITILRDPFDRAISLYFFVRQNSQQGAGWWKSSDPATMTLREFLAQKEEGPLPTFSPIPLTLDNFEEVIEASFVEVGIMEKLDESLRRIAHSLHVHYDSSMLTIENRTARNQEIPHELRESFMRRHPLEYAIYNYVASKFDQKNCSL